MGENQRNLPQINEVASYIDDYAPTLKTAIELRGGEQAELLKLGVYGGDEEEEGESAIRESLIARANVLDQALADAITTSQPILDNIVQKFLTLKRVRFVALLAGALGSSAVVGSAFAKPEATLIAGILALLANLTGLIAENLILGSNDSEDKLREAATTFTKVIGEGELTRRLLSALSAIKFDLDEMRALIANANNLFAELNNARSLVASIK